MGTAFLYSVSSCKDLWDITCEGATTQVVRCMAGPQAGQILSSSTQQPPYFSGCSCFAGSEGQTRIGVPDYTGLATVNILNYTDISHCLNHLESSDYVYATTEFPIYEGNIVRDARSLTLVQTVATESDLCAPG